MELVNMIRIIRPIEDAAQKEYIREFFRFIGCLVSDLTVDTKQPGDWQRCLQADNEENGVDIVVNFYGNDASRMECASRGIKRIYLYWELSRSTISAERTPKEKRELLQHDDNQGYMPRKVLDILIDEIWGKDENLIYLKNILNFYVDESPCLDDLFYFLQAKRCLQALNVGNILENAEPEKIEVTFGDYLCGMLVRLSNIYKALSENRDPYSVYTRINAVGLFWEVVQLLPMSNYELVKTIVGGEGRAAIPPVRELIVQAGGLLEENPQFLAVLLIMADLYRSEPEKDGKEEACYLKVLQSGSKEKKEYGFIWYRVGTFYEKTHRDIITAVRCYGKAVQANPQCYQALFRLGYHSMLEGRFKEAENMLNLAIDAILNGKTPERNQDQEFPNWQFLSLKEARYIYMTYILLAKIAINSGREYAARAAVGKACLAATKFEEALLVGNLAEKGIQPDAGYINFKQYHEVSQPVLMLWRILEPWSQYIVQDDYVRHVVWVHLDEIYNKRRKQKSGG